jgi:hypothetical protein
MLLDLRGRDFGTFSDPADWIRTVAPAIASAARELEAFRTRNVHITGSARLPIYCAIGCALPEVRRWTLSIDQPPGEWTTDAPFERIEAREVTVVDLTNEKASEGEPRGADAVGPAELALGVALTHDLTPQVEAYVKASLPLVQRLVVLGPPGDPSPVVVTGASWCRGWTRAARDRAVEHSASINAKRVHLFLAAPAGAALMLGFQWNLMPESIVYEYLPSSRSYFPTLTLPGH